MIIFIGDLHGNVDALNQLACGLKLTDSLLSWSAVDTILVITGDVCDRGRDSASIYRKIMDWQTASPAFGSEVIFLVGNHEIMNISGYYYYNTPAETASYAFSGGESGEKAKRKAFAPGGWLFEWLARQRFIVRTGPFIAAHADFPAEFKYLSIDEIEENSRRLFYESAGGLTETDSLLWCRDARIGPPGYEAKLGRFLESNGASHWVCGHTPSLDGKIRSGYTGKYICVDTAMSFRPGNTSALVYDCGKILAAYPDGNGGLRYEAPVEL
ncbi:MAG: metallophosphoesterase [Spirochaetales bacterium]|nr:metallophosphoesterase [Spirochaetales bacterium]